MTGVVLVRRTSIVYWYVCTWSEKYELQGIYPQKVRCELLQVYDGQATLT